jgi:hypothetical protein
MKEKISGIFSGYIGGVPAFFIVDFESTIINFIIPVFTAFLFGFAGYFGSKLGSYVEKKSKRKRNEQGKL